MLELILDMEIESLNYVDSQTTLAPYRESKSVRYDVYTKNEKASYDVEMRHGKAFEGLLARYFG